MIRVIGIGSPFGDDRASWEVIRELEARNLGEVDLLTLNQPGSALIGWFEGVDRLLLVDQLVDPEAISPFLEVDLRDLDGPARQISSHGQQLKETLTLADTLDCLPRKTEIYALTLRRADTAALGTEALTAARALADHLAAQLR